VNCKNPNCGNSCVQRSHEIIRSITHARALWAWATTDDLPIKHNKAYCIYCDTHIELPPEVMVDAPTAPE